VGCGVWFSGPRGEYAANMNMVNTSSSMPVGALDEAAVIKLWSVKFEGWDWVSGPQGECAANMLPHRPSRELETSES